jgi:molecular chaperone DnaK
VPYTLLDFFQKQGLRLVEASLQRVVGKGSPFVTEVAQFRQLVVQPTWAMLPLPIRAMMGRNYARWEELYQRLRDEIYDLSNGTVQIRPDATPRVAALLWRFYGPDPGAATSSNRAPPSHIPIAPPVHEPTEGASVPLAMPIRTPPGGEQLSVAKAEHNGPAPSTCARPGGQTTPSDIEPRPAGAPPTGIVVGIDLGTTYSLIAHVDAKGRPCCVPNGAGDLLTPSVVLFDEDATVVGKEAVLASTMEPDKVAECVKRDMGAKVFRKKVAGEYLPPEVISSLILKSLKADAERKLGPIRQAVITVPAYFEETRRRATMDAGRLAGLEVLDIINEPTAAAIAYGYSLGFLDRDCKLTADQPLRVLVYDLGGGTFDVTIVEIQGQHFKALATDGDVCLGGKDWDEKLIEIAAERFRQQCREDPRDNPVSLQELTLAAEAAKRTLTERKRAALFVNHLGNRLKVEVSREEFEDATAPLLERTRLTSELVVRQANLTWQAIDRVLLVGGSTRMPMVPRMLEELTGKPPDRSISVDEAVAHGAALYASMLGPRQSEETNQAEFSVTNVNSHSLGVRSTNPGTGRKINKILIPKNTPLPRTAVKRFKTLKSNQRDVLITVLEGESEHPEVCTQIGVCTIKDLPADLPAGWPVVVSYTYEAKGRLHVSAKIKGHKAAVTTDFTRENSMPDEDLELWAHYVQTELADVPE